MSGGRPTIPADEALAYIQAMVDRIPGHTRTHHSYLAGVSSSALVRARRSGRMEPDTAARLMAVRDQHVHLRPPAQVPMHFAGAHCRMLREVTGAAPKEIGRVAGVSYQTIYNALRADHTKRITWSMHAAIMAVRPESLGLALVERWPSVVRARALQANGWPIERLSEMWDMNVSNHVRSPLDSPMYADVERRIREGYEAIGDRPGGCVRAARRAKRLGFFPPIYYDEEMRFIEVEEDTDEQHEQHEARLDLCILVLTMQEKSTAKIGEMLGVPAKRINQARARARLVVRASPNSWSMTLPYPGADDVIREAARGVHVWSTIEALDDPDVDYAARLATIVESVAARAERSAA